MSATKVFRAVCICALLIGCSGGSDDGTNTPPPPPPNPPPPPPPPTQHLYVGDDASTGSLRSYVLPLTASSTPAAAVPMNKAFNIGGNATTLAVTTLSSDLLFFTLPLTSSSVAFATFAAGSNGTPVFAPSGSLYQGGSGKINIYTPPFTNASVPTSNITTLGLSPSYLAQDPDGNLYEAPGGNVIGQITGGVLTTTLTAAAGTQFRGLWATSSYLFACEFISPSNNVYLYALPLSASATPVTIIPLGANVCEGIAMDSGGKLYVGTPSGDILVFAPPFTSSSTASVTLHTTAIIFGMTIGP